MLVSASVPVGSGVKRLACRTAAATTGLDVKGESGAAGHTENPSGLTPTQLRT